MARIIKDNKSEPVKIRVNNEDFDTTLDVQVDAGFEAVWKELDVSKLPSYFGDSTNPITWFNNFGIRKSGNTKFEKKLTKKFKVTLDRLPQGKRLCVYIDDETLAQDRRLQEPELEHSSDGKKISFYLDFGDPPTGLYP